MDNPNQRLRTHCNKCGWSNHIRVHEETSSWTDDIDEILSIDGSDTYTLIRCLGCDSVSLIQSSWDSGFRDENGNPIRTETRYPPSMKRRHPEWLTELFGLPNDVRNFLKEIYIAFQNANYTLCALGIRALLERLMIEKVGDQGALGKNITAFVAQGYIAPAFAEDFRKKVIEAGNAAMHRGFKPAASDIAALLDITESILATTFIHPKPLAKLAKHVPPRG